MDVINMRRASRRVRRVGGGGRGQTFRCTWAEMKTWRMEWDTPMVLQFWNETSNGELGSTLFLGAKAVSVNRIVSFLAYVA